MTLGDYERLKFELASILRAAQGKSPVRPPDGGGPFRQLFAKLAEDRFNLVVVGCFNRGKTSLMNALLATDRLPTGIVPLTSVITTVGYGGSARATIEYRNGRLPAQVPLERLAEYVTQRGNPGNVREVALARVELPAELLRRGFHFVDTPGIGSSIGENTRTTEAFLPEADALVLVTSYDSPLSEDEMAVLGAASSSARRLFLVVNKHDTVAADERNDVLRYIGAQVERLPTAPEIFSTSARQALAARAAGDASKLVESGLPRLEAQLVRFLVEDKRAAFLGRMGERIGELLGDWPDAAAESARLRAVLRELARQGAAGLSAIATAAPATRDPAPRFAACPICRRIDAAVYDFLRRFQYDLVVRDDLRAAFAARGGLCDLHTWQYRAVASRRGVCIAYPELLDRQASGLRRIAVTAEDGSVSQAVERLRPTARSCDACRLHGEVERAAVAETARRLVDHGEGAGGTVPVVCLHHLGLLARSVGDRRIVDALLKAEADAMGRVAEDMRRYVLRVDGLRRALITEDEEGADRKGLFLLAGHPNVGGRGEPSC